MSDIAVIDANLSILLVVGMTDRQMLKQHKRLQNYDEEDFDMLLDVLGDQNRLIFSPNVLTEISNLSRYVREPSRSKIARCFFELLERAAEIYVSSRDAGRRPEFIRLGLTDSVVLECAQRVGGKIYTSDLPLYLAALDAGLTAENFNHIRDQRPDFR